MPIISQVVLMARVDRDGATIETRSTIQSVHHDPEMTPAQIIEAALEIADDANLWCPYR